MIQEFSYVELHPESRDLDFTVLLISRGIELAGGKVVGHEYSTYKPTPSKEVPSPTERPMITIKYKRPE